MQPINLISHSYVLGSQLQSAAEIAHLSNLSTETISSKLGFKQKPVASANEHPSTFALAASLSTLKRAQVDADTLDFILYCSSGLYDKQLWSPSAWLQQQLHAKQAFTLDINQGCSAVLAGLQLAKLYLQQHTNYNYGLVVVSDALSKFINYADSDCFPLFSMADGGAAFLIGKSAGRYRLEQSSLLTDGQFVDCSPLNWGGTCGLGDVRDSVIHMQDPKQVTLLRDTVLAANYQRVIQTCLAQQNINLNHIAAIITNQNSRPVITEVINALGISAEKYITTSEQFGHVSNTDIAIGLVALEAELHLTPGSYVLLATAGIGFHWRAQLLKVV